MNMKCRNFTVRFFWEAVGKKSKVISWRGSGMAFASLAFLMLFMYQPLKGQCVLTCRGADQANAVPLVVRNDCTLRLSPEVLLSSPGSCPGPKIMTVREKTAGLIGEGRDELIFSADNLLGKVLSVTIEDENSGLFCVSFIIPLDQTAPTLECNNLSVSCTADTSVIALGRPVASDNCSSELAFDYSDQVMKSDCAGEVAAIITRKWTVTDSSGNSSTCSQMISVQRHEMEDIVFPPDTTLSCSDADVPPSETGLPIIDGQPLNQDNFCALDYSYADDTVFLNNSAAFRITRTWQVIDACANQVFTGEQLLFFKDSQKPVLSCPENLVLTTQANRCYANVKLPRPEFSDNCDPNPLLTVNTSFGGVGLGEHQFVPVGIHSVQYTVRDARGNTASCTIQLTIEDLEEPTAVCEELTVTSIPSTGFARVNAQSFDEGSYDNCGSSIYFKVRRMDAGACMGADGDDSPAEGVQEWFDDFVTFCCEEVGREDIMVVLRVYEINPGPGPVDPAREERGGDLFGRFSECMVSVTVQDKKGPLLTCPGNTTIQCTDNFFDYEGFGSPEVTERCGFTLDSTLVRDIDQCGTGRVIRSWTATDNFGNASVCEQVISIENPERLSAELIEWPLDTVLEQCDANLEPDDLAEGFDRPRVAGEGVCVRIGVNYEDQRFEIGSSAGCFEILRRWTVVDLCNYEPSRPDEGGIYSFTQKIRISDNQAPNLKVPLDTVVTARVSCDSAKVVLQMASAFDECSQNVTIRNNSPYALNNGADASGAYPVGTTKVLFTATDNCGNVTRKQMIVTVVDGLMPAPICVKILAAELSRTDDGAAITVNAETFDAGTPSLCGEILTWTVRRLDPDSLTPPSATSITFTCADFGEVPLEVWAIDEEGNGDYCETLVDVQDNLNVCPDTNPVAGGNGNGAIGMVAGDIFTENGFQVEGIMVELNAGESVYGMTGIDGYYEIPQVPFGGDYTLAPIKNDSPMLGVSTLDLVLISKHILGVRRFDSPYKIIAADIDRSGSVSTIDLIHLRKLILGISQEFPNGNTSWRFVEADYQFSDPGRPLLEYFPEVHSFNDFDDPEMYVDFVALKVGDVNNSARPNSLAGVAGRAGSGSLSLRVEDRELQAGETVTVDIRAQDLKDIIGYQFAMGFDTDLLTFDKMEPGKLPGLNLDNFGLHRLNEGWITTSWNEIEENNLSGDDVLFKMHFRVRRQTALRDAIYLDDAQLVAEAYDRKERPLELNLVFEKPVRQEAAVLQLLQNQPNPFRSHTVIAFELLEPGPVHLSVYDLSGKIIYRREREFLAGYNEFDIYAADLTGSGILYYQVEAGEASASRKMIRIS